MEEVAIGKKVSKAVNILKNNFRRAGEPEENLKKLVDGEWNLGIVYVRESLSGKLKRVYDKPRGETNFVVFEGASIPNFDLVGGLDEINSA